jgi:hypothetical protein
VDDASQLTLGEPLAFYYIWHDALKSYDVSDDVDELLTDGQELLYPVLSNDVVISCIVVVRQDGGWTLKSLGGPNLAKSLTAVRDQHAAASGRPHSDYVVIHLPHIYHIFVAHREDARLMITHVHDHAGYGFEHHQTQPAHEVINTILPDARVFQGALRL